MAKNEKFTSAFDFTGIIEGKDKKQKSTNTVNTKAKSTEGLTPYGTKRGYYLSNDIIRAINIRAAKDGVTKNDVVVAALNEYLKNDLIDEKGK